MSKKHKLFSGSRVTTAAQQKLEINAALDRTKALIENGDVEQAIEILEALSEKHPRDPNVLYFTGYAYAEVGELWQAVHKYQQAVQISRDPTLWLPLGFMYLELGLRVLGRDALKRSLQYAPPAEVLGGVQQAIEQTEHGLPLIANMLQRPLKAVEEGFRLMEQGQIALQNGEYPACIQLSRKASKLLGDFPPPYNNLSIALFFSGQWQEAIQTAQRVLEHYPGDIQALANLIQFYVTTNQPSEAQQHWEVLRNIEPTLGELRLKMIGAAAYMEDDQAVYDLARKIDWESAPYQQMLDRAQIHLVIAEVNLGKKTPRQAFNKLEKLGVPPSPMTEALKNGKKGMGWLDRFPYYYIKDFITAQAFDRFIELLVRGENDPTPRNRKEIEKFAARYPQLVLLGKKIIVEEQQPQPGIQMLSAIGTPAAYEVLRSFGLGQAGDEEARLDALFALVNAGQIETSKTVRFWQRGQWTDLQLRRYEVKDEGYRDYSPQAAELLNQGLAVFKKGEFDKAEKLFLRVIQMEPRAKEAYNNLGTLYARRNDHAHAKEMFQKASEIDPMYALARCNLAVYALEDDDPDAAESILAPLVDVEGFTPQAIAFLSYVRAKIALFRKNFEEARNHLEMVAEFDPNLDPDQELLKHINTVEMMHSAFGSWQEKAQIRNAAARKRIQNAITTSAPTLSQAFSIFSKDQLTGMGRLIRPGGGWSTLKKAALSQLLIETLQDSYALSALLNRLEAEEREALFLVLERGGSLDWKEFDSRFGNDLEASPYWNFHEPESVMGRLRAHGLLAEATVNGQLQVTIPIELRKPLSDLQGQTR